MKGAKIAKKIVYDDAAEGIQNGRHVFTVTERRPRHLYAAHVWPDGVRTLRRFWISEWRELARDPRNVEVVYFEGDKQ